MGAQATAQTQTSVYHKNYGGGEGRCIIQVGNAFTAGGISYVSCGQIGNDAFIQKTDPNGNVIWGTKIFNGSGSDIANAVVAMPNGNFAITGTTFSCGPICKMFLAIVNPNGIVLSLKTFESNQTSGYANSEGLSIDLSHNGGLILSGFSNDFGTINYADIIIVTDSIGNVLRSKIYYSSLCFQEGTCIKKASNWRYIISNLGNFRADNVDLGIFVIDSTLNILWSRSYGGQEDDLGFDVKETSDGGIISVGKTRSFNVDGYSDVFVVKTDAFGELEWSRTIGNANYEVGYSVEITEDDGYVFTGFSTDSVSFDDNSFLFKLNQSGNMEWSKIIGSINTNGDYSYSVLLNSNGYLMSGSIDGEFSITKTDFSGYSGCSDNEAGMTATSVPTIVSLFTLNSMTVTPVVTSQSITSSSWSNVSTICYSVITGTDNESPPNETIINVFPNPANDHVTVTNAEKSVFSLYNSFGQVVLQKNLIQKRERIDFNLPSGVYFYTTGHGKGEVIVL